MKKHDPKKRESRNKVKIISGRLRGRMIEFESGHGLRPTGSRSREQLFNWLSPVIQGADCADLFAGSGAISFEALSRGAARCLSIEKNFKAVIRLKHNAQKMGQGSMEIIHTDSWRLAKKNAASPFDLIFIDPPFSENYISDLCFDLEANNWLKPVGYIYIEIPSNRDLVQVPLNWQLWRRGVSGKVEILLYRRVESDR